MIGFREYVRVCEWRRGKRKINLFSFATVENVQVDILHLSFILIQNKEHSSFI